MRQIQPANMPVAGPTEVVGLDVMIADAPDGSRTRKKSVLIDVKARLVPIIMDPELCCVTLLQEILNINVPDKHILITPFQSV